MKKLIFFITFATLVRFLWLSQFPSGINHDDLSILLSAKTYWLFGTNAIGESLPGSFFSNNLGSGITGLTPLLLSPILGPINMSLASARMVYIFINLITGFSLYKLVKHLKKEVALYVFLAFLIMPWSFAYSRFALEAQISLMFLMAGFYFLYVLKDIKKSFLFLLVSQFSYFGSFLLIPLLFSGLTFVEYLIKKSLNKKLLFIATSLWIVLGLYFIAAARFSGSTLSQRSNKFVLSDLERFNTPVDETRRLSINNPLLKLTTNKYTFLTSELIKNYTNTFSADVLFNKGDQTAVYNWELQGLLLPTDIILLPIGIASLYLLPLNLSILTISLLLIGPIGSTLHIGQLTSPIFRGFLLIPAFSVLSGLAILKLKKFETILLAILFIVFARFLNFYFFQLPISQEDNFVVQERVLAGYIQRSEKPIYVAVTNPRELKYEYAFFSKNYASLIKQSDNIVITDKCPNKTTGIIIVDNKLNCKISSGKKLNMQSMKDAGEIYDIYNDNLCTDTELTPWRRENKISDYNIEVLSNKKFCNRWIFK